MHPHLRTVLRSVVALVAPLAAGFVIVTGTPALAAGGTASGTAITNTATATYSDGVSTYNSQSNTVTTTVQNAPAMTIAPPNTTPGANPVSPGQQITDTYTLTNVGNGTGYFQLPGTLGTNEGVTAGNGTFNNFIVNVPGQPQQTFATVAAVNTYLATGNAGSSFNIPQAVGAPTAANQITVGVQFTATAVAVGTITTNVQAYIKQIAAGSAAAADTSAAPSLGQYNDPVTQDARMDLQKVAVVGGTVAAPTVTYTIRANNGGARDMVAVNRNGLPAGAGITGAGIVLTDKLPEYPVGTTLTLTGAPTFTMQPTGAVPIYSVDGTTWTTTIAGAKYVGIFVPASAITATFGATHVGSSQGSVTAPQAQMIFSYTINGSTASGGGNASAITNVVNSIWGDQAGYIEGPGITALTVANTAGATAAQTAPAIANANGALTGSHSATSAASPSSVGTGVSVLNGPNGFPGATGADTTTSTDYTALSYTNGGVILNATTGGNVEAVPASAAALTFNNSVQNTSNQNDSYTLTTGASNIAGTQAVPAGWTVTFNRLASAAVGACPAITFSAGVTFVSVQSGCTVNYATVFTPPASITNFTVFTPYGVLVTATSTTNGTVSNPTNDVFFVGGFVKMTKTVDVAAGQTCAVASVWTNNATTVNPGDCQRYTVTYLNVAPSGGTNDVSLNATALVITEDGNASGSTNGTAYTNNWAANTNGLYAAPVDSNGGTLGGYNPGPGAAGSSKFTDTIASLLAGATGNVVFKVQIK